MDHILRIYTNFLFNLFCNLFLIRLAENQMQKKISVSYKAIFIFLTFLHSIPEFITYGFVLELLITIAFLFFACHFKPKQLFTTFITYECFLYIIFPAVYVLYSFMIQDVEQIKDHMIYHKFLNIICVSLPYIFYVLYTNYKKTKDFPLYYYRYFNGLIVTISLFLSYITLYICHENISIQMMPAIFSTIFLLIIICISLYDKFTELLLDNARQKIQFEINKMEQSYAGQIENNIKILHSLRHDIKNHLIVIDGYAAQQNYKKIHAYINKIADIFVNHSLFDTPSEIISSLLNEKYEAARQLNIRYDFTYDFAYIHIDDYSIVTILGNLLDNALTAAQKCDSGWITINIQQMESYLEIHIANSHTEKIQEKNGDFSSTKSDKNMLHGIGIKNVHKTLDALNGQIFIDYTDNIFKVSILIPNY